MTYHWQGLGPCLIAIAVIVACHATTSTSTDRDQGLHEAASDAIARHMPSPARACGPLRAYSGFFASAKYFDNWQQESAEVCVNRDGFSTDVYESCSGFNVVRQATIDMGGRTLFYEARTSTLVGIMDEGGDWTTAEAGANTRCWGLVPFSSPQNVCNPQKHCGW